MILSPKKTNRYPEKSGYWVGVLRSLAMSLFSTSTEAVMEPEVAAETEESVAETEGAVVKAEESVAEEEGAVVKAEELVAEAEGAEVSATSGVTA